MHALTSSLLGICAGTLRLESIPGFAFYIMGALLVSALVAVGPAAGKPGRYFQSLAGELWTGELLGGLSSYVLTWTLIYNLVGV